MTESEKTVFINFLVLFSISSSLSFIYRERERERERERWVCDSHVGVGDMGMMDREYMIRKKDQTK